MIKIHPSLFGVLALAFLCTPALADVKPDRKPDAPEPVVYEGDYEDLESYGLYRKPREGSLGRDLWSNSNRSAITYWVKHIPQKTAMPLLQKLDNGVLLSRVNADLIQNDIDVVSGEDLLTLRLEKLLERGMYNNAAELYTKASDEAYHPRLVYNGALALMLSGNKSLACLEVKTALEEFEVAPNLDELSAYCDLGTGKEANKAAQKALKNSKSGILKAISKNPKYTTSYATERFKKLKLIDIAALVADGRMSIGSLEKISLNNVPSQHLDFLLNQEKLSDYQRFKLTERAVYWGILPSSALGSIYEDTKISGAGNGWQRFASAYKKAEKAARGKEQWDQISAALALGRTHGIHNLAPFSRLIANAKPKSASIQDIHTALSVLLYSGEEISDDWVDVVSSHSSQKTEDKSRFASVATALYAALPRYKKKNMDKVISSLALDEQVDYRSVILRSIIDNTHAADAKKMGVAESYEKTFPLTYTQDYVMPTYQTWDRLDSSSQRGSIGEAVLLSSNILRSHIPKPVSGQKFGAIYPGLLRDILNSLDNVGLTNVSRDLAVQVALEQYK